MMLCDWQIFWWRHSQKPRLTAPELIMFEYTVALESVTIGFEKMARYLAIAFIPAVNQAAHALTEFVKKYEASKR